MLSNYIILGFLGGYEWLVILLAVILLFGGKKIPELMKGLGKGIKEFKKSSKELAEDTNTTVDPDSSEKTDN